MQIDLEHLHYWMCAIRESKDPIRTLDAFWRGQLTSKEWLVSRLEHWIKEPSTVEIHGGWVGVLASMLFQSHAPITSITSIDIDPSCESIASMMNKKEEIEGRFKAVTTDMCSYHSTASVVINTSCEHITQEQYDAWLDKLPTNCLVVLQSNNYDIPEHVRWHKSFDDFKQSCNLHFLWGGEMQTQLYTRYMIIGRKNV